MNQNNIINAFLNPGLYKHSVDHIELIETHISWVFLTGHFAYKIKKPVDFGFLNFTDLEQRKHYCQQELVLNRRFAPQIYLEVLPVTQLENNLSLSGQGETVEYAIKMVQFDHNYLLDKLLKKQQIKLYHIDDLCDVVADFHQKINIAGSELVFGSLPEVIKPVEENFTILSQILTKTHDQKMLSALHRQMLLMYHAICPELLARKNEGHIRECHGDLHLGNITLIADKVLLFDGIEFNDSFRWIDTMSDCAFLIMDLQDHNEIVFANHLLNRYLLNTGDYSGLVVLKFYLFYRAMVRAKVAALRLEQQKDNLTACESTDNKLSAYLELAKTYAQTYRQKNRAFLAISFGLSGSGKSRVCSQLVDQLGAIQLSSDVERKRWFSKNLENLYSDSTTHKTYSHLMKTSELVLNAGYPVIVDATFLDKKWRQQFKTMAENQQIPFHILYCYAEQNVIKERLILRQDETSPVSDADISVMQSQLKKMDSLDINEKKYAIMIDTEQPLDYRSIMTTLSKF
ncbi:MAG: AAA family ATPase [gamma proteobacterium symbiont of Bathyaustriella thionipta]|nr:AAA family ATPase [gamma proteobacterium symbiont of Bathyaustriella thionipta]MCU7948771.1 AAA family ATPase [gamma proteobacterium symbiont of Bathyaustriella thionipta]MCU7954992.1 AAA family ATPase [gamma proteobacterium symbiont of Bathyaustriella thionipta]MCU7955320.1 AAA family ATPase [gamma proteobacterium symbiont of Bathyaustriella thionipta]MCU7967063.1 AAA family ATPase [gamma proteobacterium symbiont of Bathyaustriella thionipta]